MARVQLFSLAWERVCPVVVPCCGLGPSGVDVLSSTSADVSIPVQLADVLGCLALPTSDVFPGFASVPLSSLFFSFLPSLLFFEVRELPLFPFRWLGLGGAGVLMAERGSGVERGGGGQSDVKVPNSQKAMWVLSHSIRDRGTVTFSVSCQLPFLVMVRTPRVQVVLFYCGSVASLGFGLLMLNATVRYVAFISEGDTLVVATWWRQVGRHRPVQKAMSLWSRSRCWFLAVEFVPVLADGPLGGFSGGVPCVPCLALEGLSRSEVVSISRDPHPREPVEGVLQATSVLKLAAKLADFGAEGKTVVDSSVEQESAAGELEVWTVCPPLAASGSGLVALIVTAFLMLLPSAPNCCFRNLFLGAVCGDTDVRSSLTSWRVRGPGWFCLWALDLVEV
ncbi:hypothetical protein Taro_055048 [Colocasia esculenta]|uniref:Uncharacterized protein n=1 Tax=Colocasia esculenta TaxID=4460 RepID=A0A843XSF0_COLES|nr:hypothetical protein [Colocasia esculenta]